MHCDFKPPSGVDPFEEWNDVEEEQDCSKTGHCTRCTRSICCWCYQYKDPTLWQQMDGISEVFAHIGEDRKNKHYEKLKNFYRRYLMHINPAGMLISNDEYEQYLLLDKDLESYE